MANFFWSYFHSTIVIMSTRPHDQYFLQKMVSDLFQPNPIFITKTLSVLGIISSLLFAWPWEKKVLRNGLSLAIYVLMAILITYNYLLLQLHYAYISITLIYYAFFFSEISEENYIQVGSKKYHSKHFVMILFMSSYTISGLSKLFFHEWWSGEIVLFIFHNVDFLNLAEFFKKLPLGYYQATTNIIGLFEILALPLYLWRRTRFIAWAGILVLHLGIFIFFRELNNISFSMIFVQLFYFEPSLFRNSLGFSRYTGRFDTAKIISQP